MTPTELLGRLARGRHRGAHARVVDQDVDPAEPVGGRRGERAARVGVAHIGGYGQRLPPGLLDEPDRLGEAVGPAGGDHDVGAGLRQGARDRHAQPGRGAGDDGDPAVETEAVEDRRHGAALRVASAPSPVVGP